MSGSKAETYKGWQLTRAAEGYIRATDPETKAWMACRSIADAKRAINEAIERRERE